MTVALKVVDVSKKYILAHQKKAKYGMLRDVVTEKVSDLSQRLIHPVRSSGREPMAELSTSEEFWALRDINFQICQGEVVGIIGRNGAGKSTLLKILSRITEPTTGYVAMKGRVNSLLEVGTGFHAELTGRENVFLNGSILGMNRGYIKKKFDEIVAFAEVEKFLDTPMKRYSSGMQVRLAFAIAAHLESDVLIVDEVLAVGDAAFQKKCLAKMREFAAHGGRSILFVSHTMSTVQSFCSRCLLLQKGQVIMEGESAAVISNYLGTIDREVHSSAEYQVPADESEQIRSIRLLNHEGVVSPLVVTGRSIGLEIELEKLRGCSDPTLEICLENVDGVKIFSVHADLMDAKPLTVKKGRVQMRCRIEHLPLLPGEYWLTCNFYPSPRDKMRTLDRIIHLSAMSAGDIPPFLETSKARGMVLVQGEWEEPIQVG